MLQQTTEL